MALHDRLDGRQLLGVVGHLPPPLPSFIGALPLLGPVLGGGTPTPPILPHSPSPPSPSTPPPPSPHPPSGPPSTPSTPPPPPPSPSTPSTPLPPSSPSPPSTPPSAPSPSQPSPVQSPTNSNLAGDSSSPSTDSPSPSGGSSLSDGRDNAIPPSGSGSSSSDTGGPSSDGEVPSSPSSTTPDPPSSPSTQKGPSPSTNGFVLSADSISSSTIGSSLTPQSTNIVTGSSPLPDTISTQSPVIISGSPSRSSTTASNIKDVGSGSIPFPHTIPSQSALIISGSTSLFNNPSSTNGPNLNGAGPNSVSSALANPHHQLSPGQIAAIIIVLLIFFITLPIVIFILRRRSKIHRADRSTKWWFATTTSSQLYGDGTTEQLILPGTQTARSSFGTTVDHSESIHPTYVIPSFPSPMAEMGRGNASRPALVLNLEGSSNINLGENRHSIGSVGSDHSQYLIVSHRDSTNPDLQVATPMSVRPFSPSESFAFPKPPEPVVGGLSRPTSNTMSVILATPRLPPGLSSAPSSFVPNTTKSPSSTTNPFEDSAAPSIGISPYSDIPVQIVRCPFEPTLPDELAVHLGDGVRVLNPFDDGWGLIEKVRTDGREEERGLIPMTCLRKIRAGEELETRPESRSSSFERPYAL